MTFRIKNLHLILGVDASGAKKSIGLVASPLKLPLSAGVDAKESNGPTSPRKFFKNLLTPTKMKKGRRRDSLREKSVKSPKEALDMKKHTNKKYSPLNKGSPSNRRKSATLSPIAINIGIKIQQDTVKTTSSKAVRSSPRLAALAAQNVPSATPSKSPIVARRVSNPFWDIGTSQVNKSNSVWRSDEDEEIAQRLSLPQGYIRLNLANK